MPYSITSWHDEISSEEKIKEQWDNILQTIVKIAQFKAKAGELTTKKEYVNYCIDKTNAHFALKYGLNYGFEKK